MKTWANENFSSPRSVQLLLNICEYFRTTDGVLLQVKADIKLNLEERSAEEKEPILKILAKDDSTVNNMLYDLAKVIWAETGVPFRT